MQKNNPILINVPHSATYIPPDELRYFTTDDLRHEIAAMTDHYCDNLYDTGDTMIRFPVSRLVCDPERFRDDSKEVMASVGIGAIYTSCSDGSMLKSISPEHKEEILTGYYDRYHKCLEDNVSLNIGTFGKCLIIDGHSFPDDPRVLSVMIEINRRIYMDHDLRKTQGYFRIKEDIKAAVNLLADYIRINIIRSN